MTEDDKRANKKAPAKYKAKPDDEYILTTKLYCGKCMTFMIGESGTSGQKLTCRYYKCLSAKRKSGCDKKAVKKDVIEDIVIDSGSAEISLQLTKRAQIPSRRDLRPLFVQ